MLIFHKKIVIIPKFFEMLNFCILDKVKYFSYTENYLKILGAIYLLIYFLATIILLYINQKKLLLQIVFWLYRMNFMFYYILTG